MTRALVLVAVCVALAGCRAASDPVSAPPPQPGVDVVSADVRLRVDPEALAVRARSRLRIAHPRALRALRLGLDDALTVAAVRLDGRAAAFTREGDALVVPLPGTERASTVEIDYSGTPAAGLYAAEAAGQRVVFTDGWPDRTAGWLPAVHHPSDPFALRLAVSVPEVYDVVLSGEPRGETVDAGVRTVRSQLPAGAPSYTAAFAIGHFETVEDTTGSVPVRHYVLPLDAAVAPDLRRVSAALDTLAAMLGPYPFATFATVEVPIAYAGMENAAAPFLQAALYRETATGRTPVEEVAIHELVHQWWGNRVPPAEWRDLWLAEGPATYLTAETLGRLDGPDARMRHLARIVRETPLDIARTRLVPERLAQPEDVLSLAVYNKGAALMHVLRLTVGERAFWGALRAIQAEARPVSTAGFRAAFERASSRSLAAVFDYWASGTQVPRLETRWDDGVLSWSLSGDGGTLTGLPVEVLVRQGETERLVRVSAGRVRLPGSAQPDVWPVGVLLDIR
ncbi:MAG TPA: M1 family aminopeptidase [Rubricoccaceae bacterium]|jgi:aminopeptidase N